LGPLLFNIFINDLPSHISEETILFADDVCVVMEGGEGSDERIAGVIAEVQSWCFNNDLSLNSEKTKILSFRKGDSPPIKYLGVLMAPSRNHWSAHVHYIAGKASAGVYAIRRLGRIKAEIGHINLTPIYHSLVQCHFKYCCLVWGCAPAYAINRLLLVQKWAVRTIAGVTRSVSCRPLFERYGILTVPGIVFVEAIVCIHNLVSDGLIARIGDHHTYSTRFRDEPDRPTYHYVDSVEEWGLTLYLRIPHSIRSTFGSSSLRRFLTNLFIHRPPYSFNECISFLTE
jgi:hypothetical protein